MDNQENNDTIKNIEDLIQNGLVPDIFKMEQSYKLMLTLGKYAYDLDYGNLRQYRDYFAVMNSSLQNEAIMAAARVFDVPNGRYPTRCLKALLDYLRNTIELTTIKQPYQLKLQLEYIHAPIQLKTIASERPAIFAGTFSEYIYDQLEEQEIKTTLDKLKKFRDKAVAHNENNDKIFGPKWVSIKNLINIAKEVVGIVGWAYLSTAYFIDGKYLLTGDAEISSRALEKMLNILLKYGMEDIYDEE